MKQKQYYFISIASKGLYKSILKEPLNVPKPYKEITEGEYKRFFLQLSRSPEYEIGFDNFGNPKVMHFSENIDPSTLKKKIADFHIETINDINKNFVLKYNEIELSINSPLFSLLESTYCLGRDNYNENITIKDNLSNTIELSFDDIEKILIEKNKLLRNINKSRLNIATALQTNDKNKLMDTYKYIKYKDFLK